MIPVHLDRISKSYGSAAPVVHDVDIAISAGEFFTLLGPSGCGKSTTLRMIAGFVSPTSGRILFDGRDMTAVPPNKRGTGMVFQNYALFPHYNVAQNVAYGLVSRKVPKEERRRRVADALELVGLGGYAERRIDQLSGGQQQRVALARALVIEPAVLLLDEPLSNLDAKLREEMRTEIRRAQKKSGITSVYVTHDQGEAMAMSDRIAVFEAGKLHQVGTPREVYHHPASAFVARFIGRSNVLPGEVVGREGDRAAVKLGSGATVLAGHPEDLGVSTGEPVAVSVRPEHLAFTEAGEGIFDAVVRNIEFTGSSCQFDLLAGELELAVTAADRADLPRPGDRVGVRVEPERAWVVRP
ncbi:ABC transporter ATP-binding protein [Saccharomonospora glauca]|uniref:Spermidine/putrescine import ATP-binding protein PotA n=1 Tax=Saccharomonospora glauca K62 TaxID=928724 RepID=I1D1V9_9PSEU|nr:ABC transporter ATP-binding protein [Saccharomonospora glauca]EIE98933.1 spermidine/putrescine ABC transporter ATP-binding subunit [Saccharomonospora glauca K62]